MVFESFEGGKIFPVAALNSFSIFPARFLCVAKKTSAFFCFSSITIFDCEGIKKKDRC